MRNTFCLALAVVVMTGVARADVKGPDSIADRVARASVIVVGKVTKIEDKPVLALPYSGATAATLSDSVRKRRTTSGQASGPARIIFRATKRGGFFCQAR